MKSFSKIACLLVLGTVTMLTGCSKKPLRPDPSATLLGPQGGLTPSDVPVTADANSGLQGRDNFDANGQMRGVLEPVYFAFDSSAIAAAERSKAQAAKAYLDKNPANHLLLEGHCDWRGTSEYNLGLGDRRANETKKYLTGIGVSADKLETLSKGSEEAKKGDDAAMKKDRRVEFVVLRADASPVGPASAGGASPATATP